MALFSLLLLLLAVNCASSARIAGFITLGGSQYLNMRNILEELASRGHEVALLVPSSQEIKPSGKVSHKVYHAPYTSELFDGLIRLEIEGKWIESLTIEQEMLTGQCEAVLNSTQLLQELKGFDLMVFDGLLAICGALVAERLDIPRVETFAAAPTVALAANRMIPLPVSYVPQLVTGFSDKMTFMERVINLAAYFGGKLFMKLLFDRPLNALKLKYNIKPERSFQQALDDTELMLIGADFALEYPQPLLPGQIMVGPLSITDADAKPLPPDMEEFVSNSGGHGFIIVSFGSNVASILTRAEVDMLATAFGQLKQRVVWRLKGYIPSFLGSNIKVVEWLPQNDLLAHTDIKAFVSHVGHNSLYESGYHGVPVVAFPLFAEQHGNAKKTEHFGLGLTVYHENTDAQQLFETIQLVISEPRFKEKAMHISSLLKDRRRTPLQETCDWIEYVLRHGGARHLRPQVFNIPWYQYYLLDVMAFLVFVVMLVVMVIRLTCRCLCRVCCKKSESKTKKE